MRWGRATALTFVSVGAVLAAGPAAAAQNRAAEGAQPGSASQDWMADLTPDLRSQGEQIADDILAAIEASGAETGISELAGIIQAEIPASADPLALAHAYNVISAQYAGNRTVMMALARAPCAANAPVSCHIPAWRNLDALTKSGIIVLGPGATVALFQNGSGYSN